MLANPLIQNYQSLKLFAGMFALIGAIYACDDKKDDHGDDGGGNGEAQVVTADLQGADGLLVIDDDGGAGSEGTVGLFGLKGFFLEDEAGGDDGDGDGQEEEIRSSLFKIRDDGEVMPALRVKPSENQHGPSQELPRVVTIAVSPHHDIYLHFQHPFIYKKPEGGADAWDMSNGYQCQIFKIKGTSLEDLQANEAEEGNLECIDNQHFVDSWQTGRNSVFQFDEDSNVYYPGSLPDGGGKTVVYKRTRDGSETKEMINANICVNDFLITKNGGVFYTGTSSCDGGGGGEGGFFRYVAPNDGGVREIARDWWDFVFEPIEGVDSDQAIFFGPDPRNATTASWNSACLFRFDPDAGESAEDSIASSITCGDDIWGWINMTRGEDVASYGKGYHNGENSPTTAWRTEFETRCESSGQIFAGGGSQISAIKQDSDGEVYVIGRLRKKLAGEISCNMNIKGSHCVLNSIPYLFDADYDTDTECEAAGGSWLDTDGYCDNVGVDASNRTDCLADGANDWVYSETRYDNSASDLCTSDSANKVSDIYNQTVVDDAGTTTGTQKFSTDWLNCQVVSESGSSGGGEEWTEEYRALGKVNSTTKTLEMLSDSDEQAVNLWLIDDKPYYSTYNTTDGVYALKAYNTATSKTEEMATNFEVYNLSEGSKDGVLYYDGLDFNNNSYSFGTMKSTSPYSRSVKTGLTGTVKTIVILPK